MTPDELLSEGYANYDDFYDPSIEERQKEAARDEEETRKNAKSQEYWDKYYTEFWYECDLTAKALYSSKMYGKWLKKESQNDGNSLYVEYARKILPGAIKTQMELFASVATINTFGLKDRVQENLKKLLQ